MDGSGLFTLSEEIAREGVAVCVLRAVNVANADWNPELLAYRAQEGKTVATYWKNRSPSEHPGLQEYHRLHALFGVEGESPSPEALLYTARRNRDFSGTSPLVDLYNIVSAKTLVSIGAHDRATLDFPIAMRRLEASDTYVPLGGDAPVDVAGQYGFVDSRRRVICRMDVLQGDFSKTTRGTTDAIFILQDNRKLKGGRLLQATWMLSELLGTFCGADSEIVVYTESLS